MILNLSQLTPAEKQYYLQHVVAPRPICFASTIDNFPPGALIDNGRFVNGGIKQDIGVNMKLNITPNVTLDAAYNPDFAEIEADAPVVTANQRFPIFFQEKRPFFLEGAEIFQSPLQVFYSRTIIDPDFAAKLTGKTGKTSFGFLAASDKADSAPIRGDENEKRVFRSWKRARGTPAQRPDVHLIGSSRVAAEPCEVRTIAGEGESAADGAQRSERGERDVGDLAKQCRLGRRCRGRACRCRNNPDA